MMKRTVHVLVIVTLLAVVGLMSGCAWKSKIMFPAADEIFVTTGDGDITKPYTPVGQLIYIEQGFRIPFIFLGLRLKLCFSQLFKITVIFYVEIHSFSSVYSQRAGGSELFFLLVALLFCIFF